ncbi:hypothetical protein HMPREF0262_01822 [Clostridium sp. ATCC 29733]|nr:hypothetical protein HMPREF0262_01822 [Clostridium sp. ATCC 29733]
MTDFEDRAAAKPPGPLFLQLWHPKAPVLPGKAAALTTGSPEQWGAKGASERPGYGR